MLKRPLVCKTISSLPNRREISSSPTAYQNYVTDWRNKPKIKPVTDARKGEPNYFENEALKLQPAPGYIDRLCEIWFDKMSSQRDLSQRSADKLLAMDLSKSEQYLPKVDGLQPRIEYENVEALKNAPESVKRIFSIKYGERTDLIKKWQQLIVDQVRLHPLDEESLEAKVGRLTVEVRQLSHLLHSMEKKPLRIREAIMASIEERKKVLAQLREEDGASFESVLNKLKIAYTTPPLPEDDPGNERKSWVSQVIQRKAEIIKEERLEKLRIELIEKRKAFQAERDQKLAALDEEEKRLKEEIAELDREDDEQGLLNVQPVGTYAGHTIDAISEINMHEWMYRPPPHRKPVMMSDQLKKRFR